MPRDIPLTPLPATSVRSATDDWPLCPSARTDMPGSIVFGVIGGDVDEPRVSYLVDPQPVSDDLLSVSQPLTPTEVFRVAAPCGGTRCRHYDGAECRLAARVVTMLPTVTYRLPRCRIRPSCRWWHQEGAAACRRCPQIVSESANPTQLQRQVAEPS